ncbi:MAG: twin-arginine translocation signal domain-containing protein, partial [Cyclobacteriaceae bacterium]|nr:twin-arginine translocation signal domain-containing protein [Cyclobacteriaceae bacterium]
MSHYSRRSFIKASGALLAGVALTNTLPSLGRDNTHLSKELLGHGGFKYRVHKEWGNLDPSVTPVNNCHEMVIDRKGRLIMITD